MLLFQSEHFYRCRAFLFISGLFFCLIAKGQVVADFKADVPKGCAPLVVRFTDLSSGNPTGWFWDFGNGVTSIQQNPSVIYFTPGNYTVRLVAKNGLQSDSVTKSQFILAYQKPDVQFTASDTLGCAPFNVQFADNTSDTSGTIAQWQWDFGDGNSSSDQSPPHSYDKDGIFTVTLKAVNSNGCTEVLTKPSLIHVKKTIPDFSSVVPAIYCTPPVTVNFSDNSQGGPIVSTLWDFGDGNTSTDPNPSHVFTAAGNYNVKLTITNEYGCIYSITKSTVITTVTTAFTSPDTICAGASANFINASLPGIVSAFWDFGDGTSSTAINPVKTFNAPGTYIVKLVNNSGACTDSVTRSILVLPKPSAQFSFTAPPPGCSIPVNVQFNSTAAGSSALLWNFGDNSSSTDANPAHVYTGYGSYSVSLKVTDANGCTDVSSRPGIITITPVKINGLDNLPYSGCAPFTTTFSAYISTPEPVTNFEWSFGDGTFSTEGYPVHTYTAPGTYDVSLVVATATGCTDTFHLRSAVTIYSKPVANFSALPLVACSHDPVGFIDSSSAGVTNWLWKFGDSTTSAEQNPLHRYADTGYFSVTLIAGNHTCHDTITFHNYVYINPPVAKFSVSYNCDSPYYRNFTNLSVGAQTSTWDFGDGISSTTDSPSHTYSAPGTYIVTLRVANNNCFDVMKDTIQIIDEQPVLTIQQNVVCKNSSANFTASGISTSNILTYTWSFGDGSDSARSSVPAISHSYASSGTYNAFLTVTDNLGCRKKTASPLNVTVYVPKADFTNPGGACVNTAVTFTDKSVPYADYRILSWVIDYGDGQIDSLNAPAFTHTYTAKGTYDVSLKITDSSGCTYVLMKQKDIIITDPKALFSVSDSLSCSHSQISFINSSTGLGLQSAWSFGDNNTSNAKNPLYGYSAEGTYDVSLTVTDTFGCVNTFLAPAAVDIKDPKAIFTLSDSAITCPPALITFFNHSLNTTSIDWYFDDGSYATIDSPSHFFLTARTYNIKLVAYGYGACADSIVQKVVAKGPAGSFTYTPLVKCTPATIQFTGSAQNNRNTFLWDFGDGTTSATSSSTVSHQYVTPGKYLPKLLLHDTTLICTVSVFGSDTITAYGVKSYIQSPKSVFCDTAGITFLDSSIVLFDNVASYFWNFGDGAFSNVQNPFHNFTQSGVYPVRLTIKTEGGCIDSSNVSVNIAKPPQLRLSGDSATCVNQPVTFSGNILQDTSGTKWNWNFDNGNMYTISTPPVQTYNHAGSYMIKASATNSLGCTDSVSKILVVHSLPAVNAGNDTTICHGQTLTLQASGAVNYLWQNNAFLSCTNCAAPVASPIDSTLYFTVSGTDANGCQNTDSILVKVIQPVHVTSSPADTLCAGKSVQLFVTGADNYIWSPSAGLSNTNTANPVASPATTTVYSVVGRDANNCFSDTAYVPVAVFPVPVFNIEKDNITVSVGSNVTINTTSSSDVVKWIWFPATGLSCSTCAEPVATATNNISYMAVATNAGGCTAQDKITLQVFCNNGNVFVPNTFSPNNDGSNDAFFPRGKGIASVKGLRIFNRWGSLVFQKSNFSINDAQSGWNGTYNGKPVESDVYVYELEVVCETGQIFSFKGNITLIR